MAEIEVGDIVMCTVDRIIGTTVFVKIDSSGKEASINFSEISPGRIRNIRDFVVPKKKIICKVLRAIGDRIDLSLRRVTPKEEKEIREKAKQEKSCKSILKTILGEKSKEIVKKIKQTHELTEFLEEAKTNPKILEEFVEKKDAEKLLEIINCQKQKKAHLKKEFSLSSTNENGITRIKEILKTPEEITIKYISAGKYTIETESQDLKKADNILKEKLAEIEKQAKKNQMNFKVKEK